MKERIFVVMGAILLLGVIAVGCASKQQPVTETPRRQLLNDEPLSAGAAGSSSKPAPPYIK